MNEILAGDAWMPAADTLTPQMFRYGRLCEALLDVGSLYEGALGGEGGVVAF